MPNWCNTNIYINYDDEKALKNLYNKIKYWTSKNYADNGFGYGWLGNVVLGAEIGTVDTNPETDISCRGDIEYIDCTNSQITICTETAWSPMLELWIKVIEKYLPDAELIYDACELGNELYATNDPCLVGKYNIDPFDYNELEYIYDATEETVVGILQELLHTDKTNVDVLFQMLDDSDYAGDISIQKWEYVEPNEFD